MVVQRLSLSVVLLDHLPKHGRQTSAVRVVLKFDRRVEAAKSDTPTG